jgi:hypothetical protein
MNWTHRGVCAVSLAVAAFLTSTCRRECKVPEQLEKPITTADILISKDGSTSASAFDVDICIDATPSMTGFVAAEHSTYLRFLEDLEGSFISGVKNVRAVRYFKFGEAIREMTRDTFRQARNRDFYYEPGIYQTTNIELAFRSGEQTEPQSTHAAVLGARGAPAASRRVIVVVTDLFQRDQDVNAVVQQIKRSCLSDPRCQVALMAVPSPFAGTVYDARVPSYAYRSSDDPSTFRPFYLLMFGPEDELRRFAAVLSSRPYIDLKRFTVVGTRTVSQFTVGLQPDKSVKGVTPRDHCGTPLELYVNLRKNFDRASIRAQIKVTADERSFAFEPSQVSVRAFRDTGGKLVPADDEVSNVLNTGIDGLGLVAAIRPPRAKGDYLYVFEVRMGELNGFVPPKWVAELTSNDPRPDRDAAKTLNLDRFVGQLIAASILEEGRQPTLARFRVLIHKL